MHRTCFALLTLALGLAVHAHASESPEPRTVVETVYTTFAQGDMEAFAGLMAPDIVWNEAEGNPYADLTLKPLKPC